jgi:predicted alpha/beta hydrolase
MSEVDAAGELLRFAAADGTPLVGTLYEPRGPTRSAVLVAAGLGIGQRFYAGFAQYLRQQGHRVLTFDLRGMGASRLPEHRRSLRGLQADMLTWARQDFAAAVHRLAEQASGGRVALVGHSLGMHHAAMTDAAAQARIAVAVSVAAGSGYWRDWAPGSRRKAPLLLHVAAPLLTPLLGWFPGQRLRMVGDLPGPAMAQWSRWCRHPEFAWGCEPEQVLPSLRAARFPIHALSFTDDEAMTELCTRKLLAALPHAPSRLQVIAPADVGLKRIGHVGAFRSAAQEALWPLIESHLRAPAEG